MEGLVVIFTFFIIILQAITDEFREMAEYVRKVSVTTQYSVHSASYGYLRITVAAWLRLTELLDFACVRCAGTINTQNRQ